MSLHEDVAINPWVRYLNAYAQARVTTTECAVAISRHDVPELCLNLVPRTEGAGNAGCLLHPRSRVQ